MQRYIKHIIYDITDEVT